MIKVSNLSKQYVGRTAVDDISFNVKSGEIVGFLGPNGAGKTTTIRMLTGYTPPTSGTALIGGHDIFNQSLLAKKNIGYMPENVPLYEDMRVKEYLQFRGELKGLRGKDLKKSMHETLDLCSIKNIKGEFPTKKILKTKISPNQCTNISLVSNYCKLSKNDFSETPTPKS